MSHAAHIGKSHFFVAQPLAASKKKKPAPKTTGSAEVIDSRAIIGPYRDPDSDESEADNRDSGFAQSGNSRRLDLTV